MHAYTSSLRPYPADADDAYVASGYRTPSRFGFGWPPNTGMVMMFWVPSFTGRSSWDAFRSADPSSQPTPYAPHPVRTPTPISSPPPAASATPAPADTPSPAGRSARPPPKPVTARARPRAPRTRPPRPRPPPAA